MAVLKSRTTRTVAARGGLFVLYSLAACSSGGASSASSASTTAAPAVAGDLERTDFAAALNVDLAKMSKRTSGLYVMDIEPGSGAVAARSRTAVVRYTGYLPNGKQFDAGEITITLGANKVIRAWEDGVLGMRVGGKRRLVAPPHLAYGSRGSPPTIPPNAVLVFDMQLLSVY